MVVSKSLLTAIILGVACLVGGGVWLLVQSNGPADDVSKNAASGSPTDDAARKRAQDFFGSKKDYDLTGGQEMKPRW